MDVKPRILFGHVMHKRIFPRVNQFTYGTYYLALPLLQLDELSLKPWLGVERSSLLTFYRKDHGDRSGGDLRAWMGSILARFQISEVLGEVVLITLPRTLGYYFNPVSFWFCYSLSGDLFAVLCEVNNTFGETHSYLCVPESEELLGSQTWIEAPKVFHVSPFLPREGFYRFRFSLTEEKLGIWINYHNSDGEKQLMTSLVGHWEPLTRATLRKAFFGYPWVTLMTIARIHWQAVRLFIKRQTLFKKPIQKEERLTSSIRKENLLIHQQGNKNRSQKTKKAGGDV